MGNKLATTGNTLDGPAFKPVLDLGRMSARCIFATDGLDRVGDILNVRGIDTAAHRLNPVVLFDHGKWFGDPIGKSVDPDGNYTVEIGEHEAYQTTFFFPTQLGEQYFALIEMGGLNTNSIGYRTLKARKNNAGGKFLDAVELVELSWVGVPANGECVRAFLAKDRICGKSLHPDLMRALKPYAAPAKSTVLGGFTMKAVQVNKTLAKAAITTAKKELPSEEVKAGEPVVETPATETAPAPEAPQIPHGAEMLRAAHDHLAQWIGYCDENLARLENEDVQATLLALCEETYESIATIADLYKTQYPDLEPLPEVEQPGDEEETEESETETEEGAGDEDEIHAGGGETEGKNPALAAAARIVAPAVIGAVTGGDKGNTLPGKSYSGEAKRLTKAMGGLIKECAEHLTEVANAEEMTKSLRHCSKYFAKELGAMVEEKEQAVAADGVTEDKGDDSIDAIEKEYDGLSPDEQKAFDAELAALVAEQEEEEARAQAEATHNTRLATAAARRNSWRR